MIDTLLDVSIVVLLASFAAGCAVIISDLWRT